MKKLSMIFAVIFAVLAITIAGTAEAKSLYLVGDHHTAQFDAWNINPDGTVTYQATYGLSYATDPAGIAIDESSNTLFISSEFSGGVEMVDATTMTPLGVSSGPSDLAGLAVDDANDILYAVERYSYVLYAYDWNPLAKTLTLKAGYPKNLPNCKGAFGIALDERKGILWVADSAADLNGDGVADSVVRAYDINTWTEDTTKSFTPSHAAVDVAVDRIRGLVYTVSMKAQAWTPWGTGSTLLSKYDLGAKTETTVNLVDQGVGVAVDEVTGLVYVTLSPYGRCWGGTPCRGDIDIWDTSTTPWTHVQTAQVSGSPAGICIPREEVAYNPLNLSKDNGLSDVYPGQQTTYNICFDNTANNYPVYNVTIVENLPPNAAFISATGGGVYDLITHTVTWNIGTLPAGSLQQCVQLTVQVNPNAQPSDRVLNFCTICSDQTPPTTKSDSDHVTQPSVIEGRMTGGGSVINGRLRVTYGFELHCDASQMPNNLQVNWGKGNKFHLESLTSISCSDDPTVNEAPPVAGFDTYNGTGTGRYNGVSGATATWTFTDAGEPGKNDTTKIVIKDAIGNTVLAVYGTLQSGNHQSHKE
jgi:uncharacterized repeat protein (TIGR01451 family)